MAQTSKPYSASELALKRRPGRKSLRRIDAFDPMRVFAPVGWQAPEADKPKRKAKAKK